MKISLSEHNTLAVESAAIALRGATPVLNGSALADFEVEILQDQPGRVEVRYHAGALAGGAFILQAVLDEGGKAWLRWWLEDLPPEHMLDNFGIRFDAVENLRQYLRNGYYSWDGSFYVQPEAMYGFEPYEERPETGYAMTQLLPRSGQGCVVAGFDRHDRFQQTFSFDTGQQPPSLTILTWWDRKDRRGLARCESERLVIFEHAGVEAGLREWARICAAASPTPPRLSLPPITGWCSWYNLYGYINEENILEHLRAASETAQREGLPMRVFQIDDGFTPEMGDWLEVKPQFPRGMKPLLDDIRRAGFTPGLWIAPFMVGCRSRLFREHPDWVVQDAQTGGPLVQWRMYGEFRWHKRSEEYYILDATHPQALEYLRRVFRIWRREWGCEYFKTDFMHFGSQHGPDRAAWHTPGRSRMEIWRQVAEMVREEIGEAGWVGCGCPLWAVIGLVDGIRIGSDVGVEWRGHLSAQSLLRDQATRNFANHILWQADPDCVLLRERFHHLSETEVQSLALYAGMSGGVLMTSDHLGELSQERLKLWRMLLADTRAGCRFPFLGQSDLWYERMPAGLDTHRIRHEARAVDPVLVQVRTASKPASPLSAVFIFNTGEGAVQRSYHLADLGLEENQFTYEWALGNASAGPVGSLSVSLAPHEGALFFLSRSAFDRTPEHLPA